jgi:hypothetical protein
MRPADISSAIVFVVSHKLDIRFSAGPGEDESTSGSSGEQSQAGQTYLIVEEVRRQLDCRPRANLNLNTK